MPDSGSIIQLVNELSPIPSPHSCVGAKGSILWFLSLPFQPGCWGSDSSWGFWSPQHSAPPSSLSQGCQCLSPAVQAVRVHDLLALYILTQSQCIRGLQGGVLPGGDCSVQSGFWDSRSQVWRRKWEREGLLDRVCLSCSLRVSLPGSLMGLTCPYMDLFIRACLEPSALGLYFGSLDVWKPESFPVLLSHPNFPLNKQCQWIWLKEPPPTHTHTQSISK